MRSTCSFIVVMVAAFFLLGVLLLAPVMVNTKPETSIAPSRVTLDRNSFPIREGEPTEAQLAWWKWEETREADNKAIARDPLPWVIFGLVVGLIFIGEALAQRLPRPRRRT